MPRLNKILFKNDIKIRFILRLHTNLQVYHFVIIILQLPSFLDINFIKYVSITIHNMIKNFLTQTNTKKENLLDYLIKNLLT